MNYSYERVSTRNQDERRQEISLENYKIDRKYIDKLSGKNADRPQLNKLMLEAKKGDNIYIEAISRLGRNVDDLRRLTEYFKEKGVTLHFIKRDSLLMALHTNLCLLSWSCCRDGKRNDCRTCE